MKNKEKSFQMPTAFTILLALLIVVSIITYFIPAVTNATIPDIVMSPVNGFLSAFDVAIFVMFLGGFLGVIGKTGALDNGISAVVKKLRGKEMMLIPILMLLFSLGGTTYGMAEETIAFYSLIVATMVAAGFDPLVGAATIMLGAGAGTLGSTVNPFAIAAAVDAIQAVFPDIVINQTIIIVIGSILWLSTVAVCIFFVMRYASNVHKDTGRSLLSPKERQAAAQVYGENTENKEVAFTGRMKAVLIIFAISFVIMIVSLIPWSSFGVTIFNNTSLLTGTNLGEWYFRELQAWFFICSIIVGIVGGLKESEIVDGFVAGAADMVGVALIIAISRGISVIMSTTGLDMYVLEKFSSMLSGVSPTIFTIGSYLVYIGLSFLIPSSSGLAAASMPTFGGLANNLGLSAEVMIMIFTAASGIVNLITPTSGVVMGGLAIAKVDWTTWLKFMGKIIAIIFILNIIILSVAMMLLT